MPAYKKVLRKQFVTALMQKGDFSFSQACRAFDCFTDVIADGVVTGSKVVIGHVGAITPVKMPSRESVMGFRRTPGQGVEHVSRVFMIGPRIRYKFRVFDKFLEKNRLDWFQEP